jgi:hypothetical protein
MKISLFIILSVFSISSIAQSVTVTKETVQLQGEGAEGFEVQLTGDFNDVESQLMRHLKPVGKTKKGADGYSISLPMIYGKNYTSPLYVVARDKGKSSVWLGIRPSEWPKSVDSVKADIEKLIYDFGVSFYRNEIQKQIDESNRAYSAVERQQQKLLNQNKDLGTRLENNKTEKIQLEKSIIDNKNEFDALNIKIAQNKKDQDSVAFAGEQIKRVIEMQKDKQLKVN